VILDIWVHPVILKNKELSIYLFLIHVLLESRTCFCSSSICFCCKCDSAVVCVSCKKPQKRYQKSCQRVSGTIVELHSDYKTHITAVLLPKLALEMVHIYTHTHTHTHTHTERRNLLRTCFYTSHSFTKTHSTLYLSIPFSDTCVQC
jgi:hypothetical protein